MTQFSLLGKRRFAPFFWTQALGAFNDNAFRNALVMLVAFQMGLGDRTVLLYTNLAPALFIIPFFLFSATAGQLAEKYEKSRIIRYVKLFEIAAMLIAAIGFYTHHTTLLLVVLFLMGLHSTTFGPIKYAILPQALKPQELVGGNGLVEMGTQMAMLIGMVAGNSLMRIAGYGPVAASAATILVAVIGYLASRRIQSVKTDAMHDALARARRVDAHAHLRECARGCQRVLSFEESRDARRTFGECGEHDRAMRNRLVAGDTHLAQKRTCRCAPSGGARPGSAWRAWRRRSCSKRWWCWRC